MRGQDVMPEVADALLRSVAKTGVAANIVDTLEHPLYDSTFDTATNFRALRVMVAPMKAAAGNVIAVLSLAKGWPLNEPPAEVWKDPRLEPFTKCEPMQQYHFMTYCYSLFFGYFDPINILLLLVSI